MNKIKIKITTDHLKEIINDYYNNEAVIDHTRVSKVVRSISDDLLIKLEKKLITKRNEPKEFSLSLRYYEGFALLEIAKQQSVYAPSEFERNLYRVIVRQLDIQL